MKPILALTGALLFARNLTVVRAQTVDLSSKRLRVIHLLTGTDNGGELELFGGDTLREIRVIIGLSTSNVETTYNFVKGKLIFVTSTRTYFDLGTGSIDSTKPTLIQQEGFRFSGGREIGHIVREKKPDGSWKKGVASRATSAPQILREARFFLKIAASPQNEVDVEGWLKRG